MPPCGAWRGRWLRLLIRASTGNTRCLPPPCLMVHASRFVLHRPLAVM